MWLDLPGSGTIPLHVISPQTPAERWNLALAAPHILPSAHTTASASTTSSFRGPIPYPMQSLCTLRTPRRRDARNTRYRAARYALPGRDLHPLDRASFPGAPCGDPIMTNAWSISKNVRALSRLTPDAIATSSAGVLLTSISVMQPVSEGDYAGF